MKNSRKLFIPLLLFILFIGSFNIQAQQPEFVLVYVVQEGETLYHISRDYNISWDRIMEENDIDNGASLRPGDEIIIPDVDQETVTDSDISDELDWSMDLFNETEVERENFSLDVGGTYAVIVNEDLVLPDVDISDEEIITYHVQTGDTLHDLASDFNTSTGIIMAVNEMENNIIRPGEQIAMPVNNMSEREVIAQTITDQELELLARIIHAEARGEPFLGQVAVGAVVLNRLIDHQFPNDMEQVIYQSGQFTAVYDGQINMTPNQTSYDAAREAINGVDPTNGALYYYNPETATNWMWFEQTRDIVVTIGDHDFAK